MAKLVWLNGELSPLESAVVPAADHAHLYGDGLFEGIRSYDGRVYRLDEHLDRLYHGINFLGYNMPYPQGELRQIVLDVCRQTEMPESYIRLNVTRGTGLGLDPKNMEERCNVMVMVSALNLYSSEKYDVGLHVMTSPIRVIPPDSLDPRLKCIGRYASNILAKQYANRIGAGDGLLLNHQGHLAEGTGNNIFLVKNGTLRTPHPSCGILEGITRNAVIELARSNGLQVTEDFLTPYDALSSDEAFFTGTATEVIGMVSLDGQPIGEGVVGPVTRNVMQWFHADTQNGVPFLHARV